MTGHTSAEALEDLRELVANAEELLGRSGAQSAAAVLQEIDHRSESLGIDSGHVRWLEAVASERQGDGLRALRLVTQALRRDPVNPAYLRLRASLVKSLRERLAGAEQHARDPSIPELWSVLATSGDATAPCHVALASHHAATGSVEKALSIVRAVLLLYPGSAEAAELEAQLTHAAGDDGLQ